MASVNVYQLGDLVRATGTFTTAAGAALDPSVVKCSVITPLAVTTTYTYGTDAALVKDSAGIYHVDVNAASVGTWHYRWFSTGTGQAADEGWFVVEESEFD